MMSQKSWLIAVFFGGLFSAFPAITWADTISVNAGDEGQITTQLNAGNNVELISGQTYTLSASEALVITGSNVTLDGKNAILRLDASFNNFTYRPLTVHGDVHNGLPAPLPTAFGLYIAPGSTNLTIKNLKIERENVSGSVVRSLGVVKASDITLQNLDMSGNTIGPVIDIVDSERVTVADSNIHDITAADQAQALNLTGAGKPNLTGILVDDVDLLNDEQRKNPALHSNDIHIANNQIKNFTMHSSIFTAMRTQLGITDTTPQTDGVTIQRGWDHKVLNNVIVNVDEGVDTFGYHGLIRDNVFKLNPFVEASAALKFIHGASHNLALGNTIINRNISSILDSSTFTSLTGNQGTFGNVLLQNTSTGSGNKLHRISRATGAPGPDKNFMLKNSGGTNSSDFTSNDPNIYFSSSAEPNVVALDNFDNNQDKNDVALYFKSTGKTDIYYRTASAGFDGYNFDVLPNAVCASQGSGCLGYNQNMTHMLAGNFFTEDPVTPEVDFLFLNASGSSIVDRFQRNNGNRTFSQYSYELENPGGIPSSLSNIATGDFNGDTKTDVFFRANDGSSRLYRNDDTTSTPNKLDFTKLTNPIPLSDIQNDTGNQVTAMKTGDFNGDGKTDLFWLWYNGKTKLKLGDSNLSFAGQGQVTPEFGLINNVTNPDDVQVFDYNQDGYDDILFKLGSDTRRLFQCEASCGSGNLSFSYRNITF